MKVAAIILAAGSSSRFGQPKQLVRLQGEALVRRIARIALEAKCAPVVVVIGDSEEKIRAELDGLAIEIISNPNWQEGIASSIRAGVERIPESDAVILLTSDQPLVRPETLQGLIESKQASGKPIIASQYSDTLGVPALFDRSCFSDLLASRGDHGAKRIILSRANEVATQDFPDGAIDLDTPADLEKLLSSEKFSKGIEDSSG